jgi:hypothetical protein
LSPQKIDFFAFSFCYSIRYKCREPKEGENTPALPNISVILKPHKKFKPPSELP